MKLRKILNIQKIIIQERLNNYYIIIKTESIKRRKIVLIMKIEKRAKIIQEWIENYCKNNTFNPKALVIGISGGIDSVVSTFVPKLE